MMQMEVTETFLKNLIGNISELILWGGVNVDIVLEKPYQWKNIKSQSFDVVVCGQMLEHDEFFWLTMLEIKRVMKPEGICCIIAPSGGPEHRYPVDCYRYYPDGFRAVARYAGLEVLEVYAQWNAELYPDMDADWRDCVLIGRRPKANGIQELRLMLGHWMINMGSKSVADVNYGNSYTQETTWRTPAPSLYSSLYVDTGQGFNERQVDRYVFKTTSHYKQRYQLSKSCRGVRFDPVKGWQCIVRNLKIASDIPLDNMEYVSNGKMICPGNFIFMDTIEPQIFIPIRHAAWIEIEADINYIG